MNLCQLVERPGVDTERAAVVFEDRQRTYGELRDRMVRIGAGLARLGVKRGDRVAILTPNCLEYLEIELAITYAGAIMVPLNYRLAEDELRALLVRSGSRVLFVGPESAPRIAELRSQLPDLTCVVGLPGTDAGLLDAEYDEVCAAGAPPLDIEIDIADPHEIIFTSGTTDAPKGVVWTHAMVLWNSIQQCMDYGIGAGDSNYVLNDLYYVGGRHDFTWPIIHQGGTVHVRRSGGFDAAAVMRYLDEHRITRVLLFPVMLYEILRLPDLDRYDTSALRTIITGGEPVPLATIDKVLATFPSTDLLQVYGLTEGGATVTFLSAADARRKMGSCGKAGVHNAIRIADERDRPVGSDVIGEIQIKGPTVTPGYWEDEARTATLTSADGWLHTGDLGRIDEEGFLYVAGRAKDMIISGGMNIYPKEVEDVLHHHPSIAEVAIIGVPDPKWGERVCAVIRPEAGREIDADEIAEYCRARLASFKKPTVIEVIEAMPRTATGKVRKQVLRERFGARATAPASG